RRNRMALTVAGVVAAMIAVGTAGAVWLVHNAEAARLAAKAQHDADMDDLRKKQEEERRQEKLDPANQAAASGGLVQGRSAYLVAQMAHVEAHQVYWLNVLIQFQRGDWRAAIKEFQSSLALKPTVAAHAMWVTAALYAYAQSGGNMTGIEFWPQAQLALKSMEPVTAEDYMCKGFTRAPNDREEWMRNLDKAIEMRDSPIAHAFRAAAACAKGLNESDLKTTESGLKD